MEQQRFLVRRGVSVQGDIVIEQLKNIELFIESDFKNTGRLR